MPNTSPPPTALSISNLDVVAGVRCTITEQGLVIGETLNEAQWTELIARIRRVHHAYHNILADAVRYGRETFGDGFVEEQLEQLEFTLPEVARADAIGQLSFDLRTKHRLTSEHYFILGKLLKDDPRAQEKWAALAVEHGLSPTALKRSLEAEGGPRVITDEELSTINGRHSGQIVIQGFGLEVRRWVTSIGGQEKLVRSPEGTRRAFLKETKEIVDLYNAVSETLDAEAAA